MRWPFVLRSTHEALLAQSNTERIENFTLRDALRSANEEIRLQRSVIAELAERNKRKDVV